MTTASLAPGRVVDRVAARAGGYAPKQVFDFLLMALPFLFGWVIAKICRALWMIGVVIFHALWTIGAVIFAAVAEGWISAWPAENRRR